MKDETIDVWVAVTPDGRPTEHISFVNGTAALCMAAKWEGGGITAYIEDYMHSLGWTVRPATLTLKGEP